MNRAAAKGRKRNATFRGARQFDCVGSLHAAKPAVALDRPFSRVAAIRALEALNIPHVLQEFDQKTSHAVLAWCARPPATRRRSYALKEPLADGIAVIDDRLVEDASFQAPQAQARPAQVVGRQCRGHVTPPQIASGRSTEVGDENQVPASLSPPAIAAGGVKLDMAVQV